MKDLKNAFKPEYSIYPASLGAGAKTGDAIVDLQGFEGAMIVCGSGVLTVDMPFQLMHGDDPALGDAAAVPDTDLVGTEPTLLEATDNEIKHFAYVGTKRYLRVDTLSGTGIGWAAIIKGFPRHAPVV
jgi:hypothetical protein